MNENANNCVQPSEVLKSMTWIQGTLIQRAKGGEPIGCCLLGAVRIANSRSSFFEPMAYTDMLKCVCREKYDDGNISRVNDTQLVMKEDAIALLEETERRLRDESMPAVD